MVPKDMALTVEVGIFLATAISQQKSQFGYGFKLGTERLKNLLINLPMMTDNSNYPDFKFMKDYINSLPNGDLL